MEILKCKCGSYVIQYDLSTNKKVCGKCGGTKITKETDYEFAEVNKRLLDKMNLIGELKDKEDETGYSVI
jgi:hypothetical protein